MILTVPYAWLLGTYRLRPGLLHTVDIGNVKVRPKTPSFRWRRRPRLKSMVRNSMCSGYDKHQKEVTRGNNYFTSMNLESKEKLSKDSRKSSSKITSNIVKRLSK